MVSGSPGSAGGCELMGGPDRQLSGAERDSPYRLRGLETVGPRAAILGPSLQHVGLNTLAEKNIPEMSGWCSMRSVVPQASSEVCV